MAMADDGDPITVFHRFFTTRQSGQLSFALALAKYRRFEILQQTPLAREL